MSNIARSTLQPAAIGFALVMESDPDLRGVIYDALVLDGYRVECVADCAAVLARRTSGGPLPDEFVLALGAGEQDPDWDTLRGALDGDAVLSRAAIIVLLTIRNGMTFPARAKFVQKPFAIEDLLALVAADMAAASSRPA
jgi:DNA-binding response OmpR family regulator